MKVMIGMLLTFLCGLSFQALAQGDLLIAPTRVIFEGKKQKEEINLINVGKDTARYSISFVQKRMKEDGSFMLIDQPDSGQMFADPYLRIFPRFVTLAPQESQVIMLQCRRRPDMAAGEYRSHLYFRSEKDYTPLGQKDPAKDSTLSVQLIPIYGIGIPVIIRSGEGNVNTTLSDVKLEISKETIPYVKFAINRTGNISSYGDIIVQFVPAEGKPYRVGVLTGVGVYTNITRRNISMKLTMMPGMSLKQGKLIVLYTSPKEEKYKVYAQGELAVK
jgi:hypothetical protein